MATLVRRAQVRLAEARVPREFKPQYRAMVSQGVPPVHAAIAVNHPEFRANRLPVKAGERERDAFLDAYDLHVHSALFNFVQKTGQWRNAFFHATPNLAEFHAYLLDRGVPPGKAWAEAVLRQRDHPLFDARSVRRWRENRWTRWAARRVHTALFERGFNRESAPAKGVERKRDAEVHLQSAFEKLLVDPDEVSAPMLTVFWGGHKTRKGFRAERRALNALSNLQAKLPPGVPLRVRILQSDLHSLNINHANPSSVKRYGDVMRKLAADHGFEFAKLSDIWANHRPTDADYSEFLEAAMQAHSTLGKTGYDAIGAARARAHSERVREGEPEDVVREIYKVARAADIPILRKDGVASAPGHFFVVYGDPKEAAVCPPRTLFFWPHGRGDSRTPWFGGKLPGKSPVPPDSPPNPASTA